MKKKILKMQKLSDIFKVQYGVNLELNALNKSIGGINFVSRTAKNNGVSARVEKIPGIEPIPTGTISVAGGGSVMESFLQTEPYYSGRDLYFLTAIVKLTTQQKLFYCACVRANKYRFNYGRQANRTLPYIMVPAPHEIPNWINTFNPDCYKNADLPKIHDKITMSLKTNEWKEFKIGDLFDVVIGQGPLKKRDVSEGETPHISTTRLRNGISYYCNAKPIHKANVLTVANDGSVGETFLQINDFVSSYKVNVLTPKQSVSRSALLFVATMIKLEKYRYSYGRKWGIDRMRGDKIKLPVAQDGQPDWNFMEQYIGTLPFSGQV